MKTYLKFTVVLSGIAVLFSSCATSRLTNMWRDTSYTSGMANILVISVKKNTALRRIWEDGFTGALRSHGIKATPSYRLFPADLPDTNQVIDAVNANRFDGVLIATRLESQMVYTSSPGYVTTVPVSRYDPWRQAYWIQNRREYHEGTTDSSKVVRYEINLWSTMETGRLIWTGTTEVLDPTSSHAVNDAIVSLVIPELEAQRIIPGETKAK